MHTIEVVKKANSAKPWRVSTFVYGSFRGTFAYATEKAAVRKVQELERGGYTLKALPVGGL
jgi:hypothetical protein